MDPRETSYLRVLVDRGFIGFGEAARIEEARQAEDASGAPRPVWDLAVELGHVTRRQSEEALGLLDSGTTGTAATGQPSRISARRGRELGGYELVSKLGQGGMGAVYKARQKGLDRLVALKVLPRQLARDESFIDRFMREARSAGRLSHPNIVAGIDAGCADGYYYLAMEYVDGPNLGERLDREKRLSETEAVGICLQIAEALDHAHGAGMVHRDVKPENILLAPDGQAKLCDLGLARLQSENLRLTQSGVAVGTPNYISPEQAKGGEADCRSDVYALGCVLFHLVAGRPPFQGESAMVVMQKHLNSPTPRLAEACPGVSGALDAVVAKMMARDAAARHQSAADAAADLRAVLSGAVPAALKDSLTARSPARRGGSTRSTRPVAEAGVSLAATRSLRPVRRRESHWPMIAAAGAVLLALGLAAFAWGLTEHRPVPNLPPPPDQPVVSLASGSGTPQPPSDDGRGTQVKPPVAPTLPGRCQIVLRQGAAVPELNLANYAGTTDTTLAGRLDPTSPEPGMGGGTALAIGRDTRQAPRDSLGGRSVLRFDLSALPRGTEVEKAELTLSCRNPSDALICLYRVTSPWQPSESIFTWDTGTSWTYASGKGKERVPWKTPGGDYDSATDWGQGQNGLLAPPLRYLRDRPVTFDVTGVARAWVTGKLPNYGFLLVPRELDPPGNPWNGWLSSSEGEVPEQRPTLTMIVRLPAGR
jgi:serine/threonine-protein kinase